MMGKALLDVTLAELRRVCKTDEQHNYWAGVRQHQIDEEQSTGSAWMPNTLEDARRDARKWKVETRNGVVYTVEDK